MPRRLTLTLTLTQPRRPLMENQRWHLEDNDFVPGGSMTHGNGQIYSLVAKQLCVESMGASNPGARLWLKRCRVGSKGQQFR